MTSRGMGGPGATFYLVVGIVMLVWCVDMAWMKRVAGSKAFEPEFA